MSDILEMLAENVNAAEILKDLPDWTEDSQACLLFAARYTNFFSLSDRSST